jgi:hypothetical protein
MKIESRLLHLAIFENKDSRDSVTKSEVAIHAGTLLIPNVYPLG